MTVVPMTFATLFASCHRLLIPIFQRKYCWTNELIQGWWQDLLHSPAEMGVGHRTGKLIFYPETREVSTDSRDDGRSLLCVDGQQRLTTTMLLLAALRDALWERAPAGKEEEVAELVDIIHDVLFVDSEAGAAALEDDALVEQLADGEDLPFVRLSPSYIDRAPFFACLLSAGRAQAAERFRESVQHRAKADFDANVAHVLHDRLSADQYVFHARRLLDRALRHMTIMYVGVEARVDLPQLFLWMQEKALFSMGALLYNPRPGIRFHAVDFMRNLLLAAFVQQPAEEQARIYRDVWIHGLERNCSSDEDFDSLLAQFLQAAPFAAFDLRPNAKQERHVSAFEQQMYSILGFILHGDEEKYASYEGVLLYARFFSFYDEKMAADADVRCRPERVLEILDSLSLFFKQHASLTSQKG